MNIHTRLVGVFDAIILSSLAAMTVVVTVTLLNPSLSSALFETMGTRATVTIEQLA